MPRPIRYIPLIGYWLALAIGSHWPRLSLATKVGLESNESVPLGFDKWLHTGAYAGLTWLIGVTLFFNKSLRKYLLIPAGIALVYAAIDELTQTFVPGRSVMFSDYVASAIGVGLAIPALFITRIVFLNLFSKSGKHRLSGNGENGGNHRLSKNTYPSPPATGDFVGHARLVALLTLCSRVFGLVRDWALAFTLGFGWIMDAFVIAFMVPNLFRRLFGEGALAGAFIPQFAELNQANPAAARAFARRVLKWLTLGLAAIAGLTCIALVAYIATIQSQENDRGTLTAALTAVTIWYMPLVCVTAILGAILQTYGRFGLPALAPVILNVCIIGSALGLYFLGGSDDPTLTRRIVWGVAIAVIVAGLLQAGLSILQVRQHQRNLDSTANPTDTTGEVKSACKRLLLQWGPTTLGLAVLQLNTLADALIAMFFSGQPGEQLTLFGHIVDYPMQLGAVAVLGATARLYEFPLGVFGIAVATAIFPALATAAKSDTDFTALIHRGIRLTIFIGLPATAGLLLVREPLARAIYFESGQLRADDALRVAHVLVGYATAVWAYSLNHLLVRAFYAKQAPKTPMKVSLLMVTLNVGLNLTLIWPLGVAGLAWSTAICATLQAYILLHLLRRYVPEPIDRPVAGSLLRSAAMTLVMAGTVFFLSEIYPDTHTRIAVIGELLTLVTAGGLTALLTAKLLRMPELTWLLSRKTDVSPTE